MHFKHFSNLLVFIEFTFFATTMDLETTEIKYLLTFESKTSAKFHNNIFEKVLGNDVPVKDTKWWIAAKIKQID